MTEVFLMIDPTSPQEPTLVPDWRSLNRTIVEVTAHRSLILKALAAVVAETRRAMPSWHIAELPALTAAFAEAERVTKEYPSEASAAVRPPEQARQADIQPCVICEWPVLREEGYICACCGIEQGYDDPATYQWNGEWWAKDKGRMPKILRAALPVTPTQETPE